MGLETVEGAWGLDDGESDGECDHEVMLATMHEGAWPWPGSEQGTFQRLAFKSHNIPVR